MPMKKGLVPLVILLCNAQDVEAKTLVDALLANMDGR